MPVSSGLPSSRALASQKNDNQESGYSSQSSTDTDKNAETKVKHKGIGAPVERSDRGSRTDCSGKAVP